MIGMAFSLEILCMEPEASLFSVTQRVAKKLVQNCTYPPMDLAKQEDLTTLTFHYKKGHHSDTVTKHFMVDLLWDECSLALCQMHLQTALRTTY